MDLNIGVVERREGVGVGLGCMRVETDHSRFIKSEKGDEYVKSENIVRDFIRYISD